MYLMCLEAKDILIGSISKERSFLAIDNIWNNHKSMKQTKMFLEAPFHRSSFVSVTSSSPKTVELVGNRQRCML